MIKLESAHIEELRGIRKLDIDFQRGTYAISGPNGSGKSGLVDAIEFGLTGQIGRLRGQGTQGLSIAEHGPHVDKTKYPEAASVELSLFLPTLGKMARITRRCSAPTKPTIVPSDDDVKAVLAEIAQHPEITLSRREILRFILVEPAKRSEEIQTILKLDEIGQTRAVLKSARNKLQSQQRTAAAQVETNQDALLLHLGIATLRSKDLLQAVNQRRKLLRLPEISELTPDTKLDTGLSAAATGPAFNKESARRDLNALAEAARVFPELAKAEADAIVADLAKLESDPELLAALRRHAFIEKGLELVDGPACPLCDSAWEDEQHLLDHLRAKLAKSAEAQEIQDALLRNGDVVAQAAVRVAGLLEQAREVAEELGDGAVAQILMTWKAELDGLNASLTTVDGLTELRYRLTTGWLAIPEGFPKSLSDLIETVTAKPDQTAALDAQTFLSTAQVRLSDYRTAKRKNEAADIAYATANEAYEIYCSVLEEELNVLYEEVEKDFSTFYRAINDDDESTFTAKLTPTEGQGNRVLCQCTVRTFSRY